MPLSIDTPFDEPKYCGISQDIVVKLAIVIDLLIFMVVMVDMPEPLVIAAIILAVADFLVFVAFARESPVLILPFFVGRAVTLIFGAVATIFFTYAAIAMPKWWLQIFIRTSDPHEEAEFQYIAQLMTAFIVLLVISYEGFQYFTLKVVYQAFQQLRQKAVTASADVEVSDVPS